MTKPVAVIGVGVEGAAGLSQALLERIARADQLWGSQRLLGLFPHVAAEKREIKKNVAHHLRQLVQRPPEAQVVILASGDPGFFGIGATLLTILPPDEVLLFPQPTTLQAAFARLKIPWSEAAFTSAHARRISEVIGAVRRYAQVGILTDPRQNPGWVAEKLIAAGVPDCTAYVLQNLGAEKEKIVQTRLVDLPGGKFADLNVLVLIQDPDWKPVPSFINRPDEAYVHVRGMITKRDVRAVSISRLAVRENDMVWDIGAGSGAVSIELAELAWRGRVYAVEKDNTCLNCIRTNLERFGCQNVEIVAAAAPEGLIGLPEPDAVFIGGSGGKLEEILLHIESVTRKTCRVIANFTLLENLLAASHWMQQHGWQPEITEACFSYGKMVGSGTRLAPANPVYILGGTCMANGGVA